MTFGMGNDLQLQLSQSRMRQKYTRVNILRCANFTPGSDQMQILFLKIPACKFTIMSHAKVKFSLDLFSFQVNILLLDNGFLHFFFLN